MLISSATESCNMAMHMLVEKVVVLHFKFVIRLGSVSGSLPTSHFFMASYACLADDGNPCTLSL